MRPALARAGLLALLVGGVAPAAADRADASTVEAHLARARDAFEKQDLPRAREELMAAYALDARPDLLFALGQVELNLEHFAEAITYYEQFLATDPAPEQATVAQQAIGAARMRLSEPPRPPPPPRRDPLVRYGHRWDPEDTGLAIVGLAGFVSGALLVHHGRTLDGDRSGTFSAYSARQHSARNYQLGGAAALGAGVVASAFALVHWRLEVDLLGIAAIDHGTTTGVAVGGAW